MSSNMTIATITHLLTSATTTTTFVIQNYRGKRQLWNGYGYESYYGYGFHWSRIMLIILPLVALFLCCLMPCICALGIWFAGWFGLRSQTVNKNCGNLATGTNSYAKQQQPVASQTTNFIPIEPGNSREHVDSYIYEEKRSDRYYHRPPSPHPRDEQRRNFTSSRL
uniref:Uncharacterized protein n=1 Tax=Setaria digitata TaxID=48799 RepID=A0A915PWJ7_9BILA